MNAEYFIVIRKGNVRISFLKINQFQWVFYTNVEFGLVEILFLLVEIKPVNYAAEWNICFFASLNEGNGSPFA